MIIISDPSLKGTRYEGRWVVDASRDEIVDRFDDFERDVRALVKVDPLYHIIGTSLNSVAQLCEEPSKWALHVLDPLPFCARKRVALIGDAVCSCSHLRDIC